MVKISQSQIDAETFEWLDAGGTNVTVTSTSLVDITGVSTTWTNPYNSTVRLEITVDFMLVANGGTYGAYFTMNVGGVDLTQRYATLISGKWDTITKTFFVDVPANATVTIKGRMRTQSGGSISWGRDNTDASFRTRILGKVVGV